MRILSNLFKKQTARPLNLRTQSTCFLSTCLKTIIMFITSQKNDVNWSATHWKLMETSSLQNSNKLWAKWTGSSWMKCSTKLNCFSKNILKTSASLSEWPNKILSRYCLKKSTKLTIKWVWWWAKFVNMRWSVSLCWEEISQNGAKLTLRKRILFTVCYPAGSRTLYNNWLKID